MIDDFDPKNKNNDGNINPENSGNNDNTYNSGYNNGGNAGNTDNGGYNNGENAGNTDNGGYNNGGNAGNSDNGGYNNGGNTGNTGNGGYNNNEYNNNGYSGYGNGYNGYSNGSNNQNGSNWNNGQPDNQNYGNDPNHGNQYDQYGGNIQYKWNYDDYQKALNDNRSKAKKKKRGLKPFIITVSSVLAVAVVGLVVAGVFGSKNKNITGGAPSASTNAATLNIQSQPSSSSSTVVSGKTMTTEQVASSLTPAVVGIEIYNLTSIEPSAEGSGIIMSKDGYIVTNAHVIEGAQKIRVVLSNGKEYDSVKTVGQDTKTDLAVLKIDATGLTAASFGNSGQLKVGQSVVAIGNPGGLTLASSVTDGIISGLNRSVSTSSSTGSDMTYIQTNAQINPGNSGGPLVNMYGQVVGINSAKITESGYEGIGFAIPINTAKPVIDSIIANGYVTGRVKVGISVYSLSNSQAKWYNFPSGLYVEGIEQTSDAYSKGLRAKDIITAINRVVLANDDSSEVYNTFYKEEKKHKVGETITLTVYRTETNSTMTFSVKLEEDKGDTQTTTSSSTQQQNGNSNDDESDYWSQFFK